MILSVAVCYCRLIHGLCGTVSCYVSSYNRQNSAAFAFPSCMAVSFVYLENSIVSFGGTKIFTWYHVKSIHRLHFDEPSGHLGINVPKIYESVWHNFKMQRSWTSDANCLLLQYIVN